MFCGNLVCTQEETEIFMRNSRKSEKLREKLLDSGSADAQLLEKAKKAFEKFSLSDSSVAAKAHKDKLINFDKTAAKRTKVIDDQSDYFNADSNRYFHLILSSNTKSNKNCQMAECDGKRGASSQRGFHP